MATENNIIPLLELRHVSKSFGQSSDMASRIAALWSKKAQPHVVRAVDDVSLAVAHGEVLGLVGESGSGKSTLARMAVGLHTLSTGSRWWKGEQIDTAGVKSQRAHQLAIQMVFQDPYASLNPRKRVRDIIGEAPVVHDIVHASQQREYVEALLQRVGLAPDVMQRFPHQFSGGQRARIGIARALAVKPEFLVCDEAVAALDVSIQAQVLNLFIKLRDELNLTYLFISHDLSVVRHLSDRVAVMYLGRIVEVATTEDLFQRSNHPYTIALLASAPKMEVKKVDFYAVKGEVPSPLHAPSGCHFHSRCPHAFGRCTEERPVLKEIAPGHLSACHLNDK